MDNTKQTLKAILPYIVIGILIVIASFFMKSCENKPDVILTPTNQLTEIIADKEQINEVLLSNNKSLRLQIDSLKHLKPKVVIRYKTVYDSLLVVDSVCIRSLNTLYNECQKVDSVNNAIITNQEKHIMNDSQIIGNLTEIVYLQKLQHIKDSIRNKQLTDTIPTVKRKGYVKGFIHGFGSGAAVTKGVEVITNLK